MGFALIWAEGLAVALFSLALATAWTARGRLARALWIAVVYLLFFGAAAALVVATFEVHRVYGALVRTTWFSYSLSWLVAFTVISVLLLRRGMRRPEPGLARAAASWPRRNLWLGFGGAMLALGFTFWNMDLAARADLAIARQEAGAVLLAMTPPPVAESENAALVYAEATKDLDEPIRNPWQDAVSRGIDKEQADWKDPYVVELVKKHEDALALLRKAAAMPRCSFDNQRSLDVRFLVSDHPEARKLRQGAMLLAVHARVKATQGDVAGAFEDVAAILGMIRQTADFSLFWSREAIAWRTLEDVLRLAPPGKGPLPALAIPELIPLVRKTREEHAIIGMVGPAAASQPSLVVEEVRRKDGPLAAFVMEAAVMPSRVVLMPDEVAAMRKLFEYYHQAPRSPHAETPKDWADLRNSVETDPTSIFSAIYIKPKQKQLAAEGARLAALRQTARTGLAAAAYQRTHGRYPDRLEQLVPEFLPAMPVDPRDGQPLRIKRFPDLVVIYAPQDENWTLRRPEGPGPIFRLYPSTPPGMP